MLQTHANPHDKRICGPSLCNTSVTPGVTSDQSALRPLPAPCAVHESGQNTSCIRATRRYCPTARQSSSIQARWQGIFTQDSPARQKAAARMTAPTSLPKKRGGRPKATPKAVPTTMKEETARKASPKTKTSPVTSQTVIPDSPVLRATLARLTPPCDGTLCQLCGLGRHVPKVLYDGQSVCLVCRVMIQCVKPEKREELWQLEEMRLKTLRLRWYSEYAIDPHAFDHWRVDQD